MDPENNVHVGCGGPDIFKGINVFYRGPNRPPSRSILIQEVQLVLEGVRTSISKETYSHLRFSRERGSDLPVLDPHMIVYNDTSYSTG